MQPVSFVKMHGLGNDFVLMDCLQTPPPPDDRLNAMSQAICDRHFGVGGDGLILILPDSQADYRMRMFNPDGSESEMCGNGIRCFGKYLFDAGLVQSPTVSVATMQGLQHIEIQEDAVPGARATMVRVDMGAPRLLRSQIPMTPSESNGNDGQVINEPLQVGSTTYRITAVSMGNPHCVIFVDDVESVPLKEIGLEIEHHEAFPQRTNVHFVQILGPQKLWMRTWERGAGDTLACGSGACAVAVATALNGRLPGNNRRALVHLPGGDLDIEWAANNHVYMTGPATDVFAGSFDEEFLNSIER
ncbi:MAG: diaminopimelate epimerase [Abitibacteriaceae bacterium]|nr:diaminopimelate epimerase [Abditibacteriaceae bacterium]